jgi:hypothetical protein
MYIIVLLCDYWYEQTRIPANNIMCLWYSHKVLTYVEYRAVSGVFRTINPPTPSPPSECVLPGGGAPTKGGEGVHTRRAVRGWGVNISEDARYWIDLLQYNPSTAIYVYSNIKRSFQDDA